jgi:hypothetical protein
MKKLSKTLMVMGMISVVATITVDAQLNIQLRVDENGHGFVTGAGPAGLPDPYPLPFGVAPDPVSGIPTLFYDLPTAATAGDILLFEVGATGANTLSDMIRFVQLPGANTSRMYFFSDREPTDLPPFDLADVALLPQPNTATPVITLDEIGVEGNNYATWMPPAGAPGFIPAIGPVVTYTFVSDAVVPEPNTLALLGVAGGLALLRKWQSARA